MPRRKSRNRFQREGELVDFALFLIVSFCLRAWIISSVMYGTFRFDLSQGIKITSLVVLDHAFNHYSFHLSEKFDVCSDSFMIRLYSSGIVICHRDMIN